MLQSHVIDVVGAAVRLDVGYRFIAADMRVNQLDGSDWPGLIDVNRVARQIYLSRRIISPAAHH